MLKKSFIMEIGENGSYLPREMYNALMLYNHKQVEIYTAEVDGQEVLCIAEYDQYKEAKKKLAQLCEEIDDLVANDEEIAEARRIAITSHFNKIYEILLNRG